MLAEAGEDGARAAMRRLRRAWRADPAGHDVLGGHRGARGRLDAARNAAARRCRALPAKEHGRDRDEFARVGELLLP